eukprot:8247651-Lingulodinium_polyedra.AAC.1
MAGQQKREIKADAFDRLFKLPRTCATARRWHPAPAEEEIIPPGQPSPELDDCIAVDSPDAAAGEGASQQVNADEDVPSAAGAGAGASQQVNADEALPSVDAEHGSIVEDFEAEVTAVHQETAKEHDNKNKDMAKIEEVAKTGHFEIRDFVWQRFNREHKKGTPAHAEYS